MVIKWLYVVYVGYKLYKLGELGWWILIECLFNECLFLKMNSYIIGMIINEY